MCLVEQNLNWRSHNAYSNCENNIQNQFNSGPITFTSTNLNILLHNAYQPKDSLIAAMNPTNARIESKIPDNKLKYWTSISFLGRDQTKLNIINAYRVYKNSIEISGISTNYRKQCELLVGQDARFIDPREGIISDLIFLMKQRQREGSGFFKQ